ncbi:hypothetical protein LSH36_684g01025 [Paralvinella palmiformis]|uniref:Afadin n=1 Tax=Paralvinella palmiformis TaxID=53620 RepID=A0AAD9J2M2_9ANNE|nr:hypothetical protein LSH36_684g01025 [Paralvinella palmiformis]
MLCLDQWMASKFEILSSGGKEGAVVKRRHEEKWDGEFFGVMRFFFQEADQRVSTKCIRVSNTASTNDVINTLVEKFRPDMRMLTLPSYALYEVHVNGEERRLKDDEYPLTVQLNWGKDDREGRFLLKDMDEKTHLPKTDSITNTTEISGKDGAPGFKRRLSKREKKELKKREKEAKLKDKENKSPNGNGVATKLYNELPDTSFTRSISNPEAVMRKRRQLKLEKKLQQIRSKDGGPDQGGTLKIYGESVRPDVPYKTLLLSTNDTAAFVVRETLEKYGMEKEDPRSYCLIQTLLPPGGPEYHGPGWGGQKEYVLDDDDCPLAILMHTPPNKGTVMFQLKRRSADMSHPKKKRSASATRLDTRERWMQPVYEPNQQNLPYLVEIQPDGTEPYKAHKFYVMPNRTEVGSEQGVPHSGQYVQLHGTDIELRHCVFTTTEGLVTVTPMHREAETFVNDKRIMETTILQHGMVIRFGKMHLYRFCDPNASKHVPPQMVPGKVTLKRQEKPSDYRGPPPGDAENFETTFDVDGHIETKPTSRIDVPEVAPITDLLPCSMQYKEEGEDAFLNSVISDISGNNIQFKLAPTYTLYMAVRYRVRKLKSMELNASECSHWINAFTNKVVTIIERTVQENVSNVQALSFWMANSSELLHFLKQDREICIDTKLGQDQLAQVVQTAFHQLVDCMQADLHHVMPAFLDESMEDLQTDSEIGMYPRGKPTIADVLQVLSSAMSLLRRCRVNAALTIQLFSQLFHFINMWLFNKLVLQPQLRLCTAAWGHRLKRRLGRVEIWAEKHGLELAADCHLARIIQAAHLLEAPKSNPDDIANISSTCFKLNSLQLRALLESYMPAPGEPHIPSELLQRVVAVAQSMSDELLRSEGREVRLEEDPDLQLPFLLPEDGYSCDIVKGVPNGLTEFLMPITSTGLCFLTINNGSNGSWTVYMGPLPPGEQQPMDVGRDGVPGQVMTPQSHIQEALPPSMPQKPEIIKVTFNKVKGSIGLSIVAAKGENQQERGIYVKSVVPGGGAAQDGRLQAGDQLLKVDGQSLVGLTQERAAEIMMHTGQTVTLEVAKQGAIYHGLTSLLTQPSPVMARGTGPQGMSPGVQKSRPKSEDVNRLGAMDGNWGTVERQRPLQLQHGASSSPNLPNVGPIGDMGYDIPPEPRPLQQVGPAGQKHEAPGQYPGPDPIRSRSTTQLDFRGPYEQHPAGPQPVQQLPQQYQSYPDLNRMERDKTYENYPADRYGQAPHGTQRKVAEPNERDIRPAKSLSSIHYGEVNRPDMNNRPHSGEFNHRQMSQSEQATRQPEPGKRQPPRDLYEPGRKKAEGDMGQSRDVPRSQPNNLPYQKSFYQNTQPGSPSKLDMDQMRIADIQRGGSPEKQSQYQPSGNKQQKPLSGVDIPRVELDPYKTQQHFFHQPQRSSPNAYPPSGDYRYQGPGGMMGGGDQGTLGSVGRPPQQKEHSPDIPPPLPTGPPPDDTSLPPPPGPPQNVEAQMMSDPHRMRGREGMEHGSQASRGGAPLRGQQSRSSTQQQPAVSLSNYYNTDSKNSPVTQLWQSQSESQPSHSYHYIPRPAPPQNIDRSITELQQAVGPDISTRLRAPTQSLVPRKLPPVGVKPPVAAKPAVKVTTDVSPWGREQKEREKQSLERDLRLRRQQEIRDLESRPSLTHEEQERLRRLHLDEEFDRRVQEVNEKKDEDDGDSDTDMISSPGGRAKVLELLQKDAIRREQQVLEDREKREQEKEQAEAMKIEKQERRLAQLEKEKEEHKMRQMRRQERKSQETEDYLLKQRELRERQRQEFEEQRRRQKQDEMRLLDRQREELRKKKEMEQEQLREIEASRSAEEQQMRASIRQQQQQQLQEGREFRYNDRYSHMQYDTSSNVRTEYRPMEKQGPPAPPERKSSRELYAGRSGSMSNLGQVGEPGGPIRSSLSTSAVGPQMMQDPYSKKSVSFDTNLTREIEDSRHASTSSEMSYREHQPQASHETHMHQTSKQMTTSLSSMNEQYHHQPQQQQQQLMYNSSVHDAPYMYNPEESQNATPRIPAQNISAQSTPGSNTPGVIGAQEVYRDPRDRITAYRQTNNVMTSEPQRMSFRDKMRMFAKEAGENTPQERSKISRAQQALETQYN